ncbi:MAG: hypothetical protein ACI857_001493 [Arenicella sp.]|jgi:hypothetical protein
MSEESTQTIKREKFEATLSEGNILYFRYYENMEVLEEDILESFEIHDILGVDENVKRIIHSEPFGSISKDARHLVQNQSRPATAEAYVITSLAQKIMFNLFIKVRKMKHSTRAFDKLDDAMEWIKKK